MNTALTWFRKSAEKGNASAMYNLGVYYQNQRDYGNARYWYHRCFETDPEYTEAQDALDEIN